MTFKTNRTDTDTQLITGDTMETLNTESNATQEHLVFGEHSITLTRSKAYRRLAMWVKDGYDESISEIQGNTLFQKFAYVLDFDAETVLDLEEEGISDLFAGDYAPELYWVANAMITDMNRREQYQEVA